MITLYAFGPAFGLLDPSPFVTKAHMLLRMAGLPYRCDTTGFLKAPKGKLPYIDDHGQVVADSTFIRWHIEEKYGVDFDEGLDPAQRASAWAVEKMLEDHLYWILAHWRWMDDANFAKVSGLLFGKIPWPARPLVETLARGKIRKALRVQGAGRHSAGEQLALAERAIDSVVTLLGSNDYLGGSNPCGADATVYAFAAGILCPAFDNPLRRKGKSYPALDDYVARMQARFPAPAGAPATTAAMAG
ncbi:glutathione S-transferase family protein [Noviherbaspirillum galbum]|uniref:Glutathione S-transferase family protein n=1 Tax=Noviherbaspirillum galbum TaxID=2709383 RepID=A0A6B3STL0_9BURK|nr:glutathione S-transferase family protein [Noviherbaspirillum galbum]NEX64113.1 glutathione S-transferase family protein [Noviherbaspirillum galbum]